VVDQFTALDPGPGWHKLLNELCVREARLDAGLDEDTVREIVERLATPASAITAAATAPTAAHTAAFIQPAYYWHILLPWSRITAR